jgi:tetratricopeptide (TPR) repeat protein
MRAVYKLSSENSNKQIEQRTKLLSQFPELAQLASRIDGNPQDADARSRLASAYIDHQLYWSAYELLTDSQPMDPVDIETNLNLARIWDAWAEYDLALKYAERAIDNGASSIRAYEVIGRIHLHRKEPLQAIDWYERAAQQGGNATVLANLGYAYILVSEWDKAKASLKRAIEVDSTLPEPHNNLAMVLTRLGDEKGALAELLKTAKGAVAFNNMGVLYLQEKNLDRAQMFFEEALRLDPQYEIAQRNLTALQLAAPPPAVINLPSFGIHSATDGSTVNCPRPETPNAATMQTEVPLSISVEKDPGQSTGIVETDSLPAEQLSTTQAQVSERTESVQVPATEQPQTIEIIAQKGHTGSAGREIKQSRDMAASIVPQTSTPEPQNKPTENLGPAVPESHACTYSNSYPLEGKTSDSRFNFNHLGLIMGTIVVLLAAGGTAMRRKRHVGPNQG